MSLSIDDMAEATSAARWPPNIKLPRFEKVSDSNRSSSIRLSVGMAVLMSGESSILESASAFALPFLRGSDMDRTRKKKCDEGGE